MIFDSHAHYDDEAFAEDRDSLLSSLPENNIGYVVNVAASLKSVKTTLALAKRYPFMSAALGVHPSEVKELNETALQWLKEQLCDPKAVAVGEIGLDYYWDKEEDVQANQRKYFAAQMELAAECSKPVSIHSRDAARDTIDVMKAVKAWEIPGVIHCFSYTKETARTFLDWGYYIGLGGVLTFANAKKIKEAAAYIPMDRILLETDCPYLAPVPYRGKRNSSLNLPYVVQALAEIKGISCKEAEQITWDNAVRLFGIKSDTPLK